MITLKKAAVIAARYEQLRDLARKCVAQHDDGNRRSAASVHVDENCNIDYEKNTACHCHPEYETFTISATDFGKWIEKYNQPSK